MKRFIAGLILVGTMVTPVFAGFSSIKLQAYSTATAASCSVLAGAFDSVLFPNAATQATISLGTKGSGTFTPSTSDPFVRLLCYNTTTGPTTTPIYVKMSLDNNSAVYPVSDITLKAK